jgi:hypothetical protein
MRNLGILACEEWIEGGTAGLAWRLLSGFRPGLQEACAGPGGAMVGDLYQFVRMEPKSLETLGGAGNAAPAGSPGVRPADAVRRAEGILKRPASG